MPFQFGEKSEAELVGVNPDLVKVVRAALQCSDIDFSVHDGLRSIEQQAEYFVDGASQKLVSRHLTGHAVDLYPFVGGKIRTDEQLCNPIAAAMCFAAKSHGIQVEWGGAWGFPLNNYKTAAEARAAYLLSCKLKLKKPFNDLFHFQLPESKYPVDKIALNNISVQVREAIVALKENRGTI